MDAVIASLISNTQMPTNLSADHFESFSAQKLEAQQKVTTEDFDAIESGEKTGLNAPTAPEGGDGDTSLVSQFVESSDQHLGAVLKDVDDFQGRVLRGDMTMTQKVDKGIELTKKLAEGVLQLQGGLAAANGSKHATETLMRNQ